MYFRLSPPVLVYPHYQGLSVHQERYLNATPCSARELASEAAVYHDSSQCMFYVLSMRFREDHIYKDDKQASSTLSGLNVCADGIGSLFGPLISGFIAERLGFEWATTVVGAGYLAMVSNFPRSRIPCYG